MKNIEKVINLSQEILETIENTKTTKANKYNNAVLKFQMMRNIQLIDNNYKDLYNKIFIEKYKQFTSEKYVNEKCCNLEIIIEILEGNLKKFKKFKKHNKLISKL